MKITCPYCNNLFNDTLEHCPNCGAPNSGVVRKSGNQPITIAELKQWYEDRGLPPSEVTRFFIGEDYRQPKAFGIYQDEYTGNFVVYKNKADGQRAIRYEGTDEAYAVNELYQRLKQEIIEQKQANQARNSHQSSTYSNSSPKRKRMAPWKKIVLSIVFVPVSMFIALLVIGLSIDAPEDGYYRYDDTVYYTMDSVSGGPESVNTMCWFRYDPDEEEWSRFLLKAEVPEALYKNKQAKEYFLSEQWSEKYGVSNFFDSVQYDDVINGYEVETGYYDYNGNTYYHLSDSALTGWYYYDLDKKDWYEARDDEVPDELFHHKSSDDFYYTPTWNSETQITDFEETSIYQEYQEYQEEQNNQDNWDNDDSGYDWDSGDSWDSGGSDWDSDW